MGKEVMMDGIHGAIRVGDSISNVTEAELANLDAKHANGKITDQEYKVFRERELAKYDQQIANLKENAAKYLTEQAATLEERKAYEQTWRTGQAMSQLTKGGAGGLAWLRAEVGRMGPKAAQEWYSVAKGDSFERYGLEVVLSEALDGDARDVFRQVVDGRKRADAPEIYVFEDELQRAIELSHSLDRRAYREDLKARYKIQ